MELSKLFLQYLISLVETVDIVVGCSLEILSLFQKCFCKVVLHCPVVWPPQMSHLRGLCFSFVSLMLSPGSLHLTSSTERDPFFPKEILFGKETLPQAIT